MTPALTDEKVHRSAALDAMDAMYRARYDALTDNALSGYRVSGRGYDDTVHVETWLDFGANEQGRTVITGYHVRYRGELRHYRTARGWLKRLGRACHGVARVYRIGYDNTLDTPEEVAL